MFGFNAMLHLGNIFNTVVIYFIILGKPCVRVIIRALQPYWLWSYNGIIQEVDCFRLHTI